MSLKNALLRPGLNRELAIAVVTVIAGATLMPFFIFQGGAAALGRYEGASLGRLYASLFAGLGEGSIASWTVLLGPYGLYILVKCLQSWWRASARLA